MIDAHTPNHKPVFLPKTSWIRARSSGLFHTTKQYGQKVAKGETLGMICDPYGEVEHHILAPRAGYIVGLNNQPVVNQGDALIHIGITA